MSEKILDTQSLYAVKKFVDDSIAGNYKDSREFLRFRPKSYSITCLRDIELSFSVESSASVKKIRRIEKGKSWNQKINSRLYAIKEVEDKQHGELIETLYGGNPIKEVPIYSYAKNEEITYEDLLQKIFQVDNSYISYANWNDIRENWCDDEEHRIGLFTANDTDRIYLIKMDIDPETLHEESEPKPLSLMGLYLQHYGSLWGDEDYPFSTNGLYPYNGHFSIKFIDKIKYYLDSDRLLCGWRGKISDVYLDCEFSPAVFDGIFYLAIFIKPRPVGTKYSTIEQQAQQEQSE